MSTSHFPRGCPTFTSISPAEIEVWRMIVQGFQTKEIADKLGRSPKTVDNQRTLLYSKLGVNGLVQLTLAAIEYGVLEMPKRKIPDGVTATDPKLLEHVNFSRAESAMTNWQKRIAKVTGS